MNTHHHNSDDILVQQIVRAFDHEPLPPRPDDAVLLDQLNRKDSAAAPASIRSFEIWRYWNMKITRRLTYAAAALFVAAGLTGILLPERFNSQQAFAQMVEKVANARMASMQMTITGPNQPTIRAAIYLKNPGFMRQEMFAGPGSAQAPQTITIYDFEAGKLLTLLPNTRTASLTGLANQPSGERPSNIVEDFQNINTALARQTSQVEEDGKTVLIYDVDQADLNMRIWVDKATLLPIRMETRTLLAGQSAPTVLLTDHMQWDATLDEAMFSTTPPLDYRFVQDNLGQPGPDDMIRVLRLWTALSDGHFPDELHPMNMYQIAGLFGDFNQRIRTQGLDNGEEWGKIARAIGMNMERLTDEDTPAFEQRINAVVGRGVTFMATQLKSEWHWTGKGAKLGDPDRIVCYWKEPDGKYLAIDANLNLKPLSPDQLPAAQP